ncbi:MAG: alpha/beta hydrolase [Ilumatobacteraceae bacterium]
MPTLASPVTSTLGVRLAVHELGGQPDAGLRPLLVSHATGFHGRCYLADGPRARRPLPLDRVRLSRPRRHTTTRGTGGVGPLRRRRAGDGSGDGDVFEGPVGRSGHSMGGACLLMAAHRSRPVPPPRRVRADRVPAGRHPARRPGIAARGRVRRRRSSFRSSTPRSRTTPRSDRSAASPTPLLEAYVRHGFREAADGRVHLKCDPETEAQTFEGGGGHDTWDVLPEIATPVLVIAGKVEPMQPSNIAAGVAERLPEGTYLELPEMDHFAPMTHPAEMADLVADFLR